MTTAQKHRVGNTSREPLFNRPGRELRLSFFLSIFLSFFLSLSLSLSLSLANQVTKAEYMNTCSFCKVCHVIGDGTVHELVSRQRRRQPRAV